MGARQKELTKENKINPHSLSIRSWPLTRLLGSLMRRGDSNNRIFMQYSIPRPGSLPIQGSLLMLIFLTLLACRPAMSQRNEIGLTFGGAFYMGDLNPKLPMVLVQPGGGMLYRLNFTDHIAVRANVLYMRVEGNDMRVGYHPFSDLSFFSDIFEFSLQAEVNFIPYQPGDLRTPFTPYVFAGAGGFTFHPKRLEPTGQVIDLFDVELNPDREVNALGSYSLLFGMGLKFNITRFVSTGLEWGMRRTGTDHLDDLSEGKMLLYKPSTARRGNPKNNDWYSYFGLTLTFKINDPSGARCPYPD